MSFEVIFRIEAKRDLADIETYYDKSLKKLQRNSFTNFSTPYNLLNEHQSYSRNAIGESGGRPETVGLM